MRLGKRERAALKAMQDESLAAQARYALNPHDGKKFATVNWDKPVGRPTVNWAYNQRHKRGFGRVRDVTAAIAERDA